MKVISPARLEKIIHAISLLILTLLVVTVSVSDNATAPEPSPLETPSPQKVVNGLPYTRKLRVYTTSYDGNCPGCRGRTYSGTEVTKGVCAVDPEVIPLGTWFYIPNYGKCHAEDIGGAVKGLKVDVGWEDASKGWLPQGEKWIYILE